MNVTATFDDGKVIQYTLEEGKRAESAFKLFMSMWVSSSTLMATSTKGSE